MTASNTSRFDRHRQRVKRLPKHPFIVPVLTFLGLFMLSAVLFVLAGSQTVRPSDSRVVRLHVDGQTQVVPSRAGTVRELLERANVELKENDVVEPGLNAEITEDNFDVNVYRSFPVTIIEETEDGRVNTTVTDSAQQAPVDIARQAGMTVYPEDKVEMAPATDDLLKDGIISQKVIVDRAMPIHLNLYGVDYSVRTHATTVEELMKERDITYDDTSVLPAPTTALKKDDVVFVTSPGRQIAMIEEAIAHGEETVQDANLNLGETRVEQEGAPGKKVVVYEIAQNGTRTALHEIVVAQPTPRKVVKGSKLLNIAISGDKAEILAAAGIPASQHFAADSIFAKESGWRLTARNAGGCIGLGQSCPGSKLSNACPNWQTDAICQIQFFNSYAVGRYGSWQAAYQFWQMNRWW